jgi:hypothetical protein
MIAGKLPDFPFMRQSVPKLNLINGIFPMWNYQLFSEINVGNDDVPRNPP